MRWNRVTFSLLGTVTGAALGLLALVPDPTTRLVLLTTTLAVAGAATGAVIHGLGQASIIDHTTGLFNRRYFVRHLDAELARARRHNHSLALVIMDIDDFKRYNDRYGHLTGDMVLRTFSQIARSMVRASDTFARWGGEEFALVLPETDRKGAAAVTDRIRQQLAAAVLPTVSLGVTISGGVACFPEDGGDAEELVSAADSALYRAKQSGNKVTVFCARSCNEAKN